MEIENRKAHYNYEIISTIECGIEFFGTEIKSVRKGSVDFSDSYCVIKKDEVYLINTFIAKYDNASINNHEERRTRKLLLHKAEIKKINNEIKLKKYTLIPLKLYFVHDKAKLLMGICKGKKAYDKRQSIKDRDIKKNILVENGKQM